MLDKKARNQPKCESALTREAEQIVQITRWPSSSPACSHNANINVSQERRGFSSLNLDEERHVGERRSWSPCLLRGTVGWTVSFG